MLTLISSLLSFFSGGLPNILNFFQDRSDKKHEIEMSKLQTEKELQMAERGYIAQAKVEEIHLEQAQVEAQAQERNALYQHDIEISKGSSRWVINIRALVRPVITYGLFSLLVFVEVFGFFYAIRTGVDFQIAMNLLWDDETQIIWASVVSFWFGTQAFKK
jgi:hypothetical protein